MAFFRVSGIHGIHSDPAPIDDDDPFQTVVFTPATPLLAGTASILTPQFGDRLVLSGAGSTDSYTEQNAPIILETGITISTTDGNPDFVKFGDVTITSGAQPGDRLTINGQKPTVPPPARWHQRRLPFFSQRFSFRNRRARRPDGS